MQEIVDQLNVALAGRYRIERELGRGGMATVFLAEDLKHRRRVAIKVLHPELAAALGSERFLREIEIAAALNHPHILPVHDSGTAGSLLYYVMPYVEGESLRHRLQRERQLPLADALRIARETASALDYAHRTGVIHRDIKPENILLSDQHAVVADFGIARAVAAAGGERLTATGVGIGTPAYMSPEQVAGSRELDGRADQYALGCVLYEMLSGQPPFVGPTVESLAHQHMNVAPRAVRELRTSVPTPVSAAITRALAKPAADRFGSAAEFASILASSVEGRLESIPQEEQTSAAEDIRAQTQPWPPRRPARSVVVNPGLLAAGGAVAAIALALALWKFGPTLRDSSSDPAKKAWILVAEFDGPPADSAVVAATRDLVMAALDQSEIVATVPRDEILVALQSTGKPLSTRVDAQLARELAYRSSVRTVLEGRVGRLGRGYSVVLRVVEADSSRVVLSLSDAAKDEEALIPTVGRIAKRLRAELGERRSAIQATRELMRTATPSFEAYRAFLKGQKLGLSGESRAAITWYRSALALDPDYASAWWLLGYAFSNLGEPDSALAAFRAALARPERLTERRRLFCNIAIHSLSGDLAGTLAASEQLLQLDPQNPYAHGNHGVYLASAGRLEEALESERAAEKLSPFGPGQWILNNQFWDLLWLGRVEEARALVPRFTGRFAVESPMWISAGSGRWSGAESLATALRSNPAVDDDSRRQAARVLAAVQASRGDVKAADRTLRRMQEAAEAAHQITRSNGSRWDRLSLALFSRGVAADSGDPGSWDSTTGGLVARAVWATTAGDTTLARRLLGTIRKRPGAEIARQGSYGPALIEAWLAARAGRWQDVLRHLEPAALKGEAEGYVKVQSPILVHWLAAEAYERLDRPDSAAAHFERAVAPPPTGSTDFTAGRTAFSFGHRRLALLYARMGRLAEARRHWEIFSETFTHPDPEMAPLVEEARAALASAEGIARSARR